MAGDGLLGKDVDTRVDCCCVRFVIPVLESLVRSGVTQDDVRRKGPACLVLTPTRELAIQVEEEFRKVACHMGVNTVCCYGGVAYNKQVGRGWRVAGVSAVQSRDHAAVVLTMPQFFRRVWRVQVSVCVRSRACLCRLCVGWWW